MSKFIKVAAAIPVLFLVAACAQQEAVVVPVQVEPVYDKYGVATYAPAPAGTMATEPGGGSSGGVATDSDSGADSDDGQNNNQNRNQNQNTTENQNNNDSQTSNENQNRNQSGN